MKTWDERPDWQLPPGVARGTWDYTRSRLIADDYDSYFTDKQLFALDQQWLQRYFPPRGTVMDLGCGTGRAMLPLVRKGMHGVAIDLSAHMLRVVSEKARAEQLPVQCVRANLVELDCFADRSVDCAMCLFSTLGMIRGQQQRARMLHHVGRILRPRGKFVLQVHNYWVHLFDPEGPWWMLRNATRRLVKRDVEIGDKFFPYRGIPRMFLHTFSRRELSQLLDSAGFEILRWVSLNATQSGELPAPWLASYVCASGWIVVCQQNSSS